MVPIRVSPGVCAVERPSKRLCVPKAMPTSAAGHAGLASGVALILVLLVAPAGTAATVSGTVTGADSRQPLEAMVAAAYDSAGSLRGTATTDGTGQYVLTLPAGSYRVLTYDPAGAYATAFDGEAESFETSPEISLSSSTNANVNFAMIRAGTITGVVARSSGPLAGAVVAAYNLSGTRRGFTTANADGDYSLVLPPGDYKLVAYDDGGIYGAIFHPGVLSFADASLVLVTASATTRNIDFVLARVARFRGTIVDEATEAPLASMLVFAYTPSGSLVTSTTSGAEGAFGLSLPAGDYRFVAADPRRTYAPSFYGGGRAFDRAAIFSLSADQQIANARYPMTRGGTIAGRVVGAPDTSLAHAIVSAYNSDGTLHSSAMTNSRGEYQFVVAPGQYKLAASDTTFTWASQFHGGHTNFRAADVLFVNVGQALRGFDFTLVRCGRFTGFVTANAHPAEKIVVAAYDATGALVSSATAGADGRYILITPPGAYRLLAFDNQLRYANAFDGGAASFEAIVPRSIAAGATTAVNFALSLGVKVTGFVRDESQTLLDGIEVFALDSAGQRVGGGVSSDGSFALVVPAGSYRFMAIDPERRHVTTYYPGVPTFVEATVVVVSQAQAPSLSFVLRDATRRRAVRH